MRCVHVNLISVFILLANVTVLREVNASDDVGPAATELQVTCDLTMNLVKSRFIEPERLSETLNSDWHLGLPTAMDPERHYFLIEDLEHFRSLERTIPRGTIDFQFAIAVRKRLVTRIDEARTISAEFLAQEHDFTINESVPVKYEDFAVTKDELRERWRKQIKRELLGDKLSGLLTPESAESLRRRYEVLFERHGRNDDGDLCASLLNVPLRRIDPHALYMTDDEMSDYRVGMIRPRTIGLRVNPVGEELEISYVSPVMARLSGENQADRIQGMRLIALRANNTEVVFSAERERMAWRSIAGLRRDHLELGDAEWVTLELRDPYSRRRLDIRWPRIRAGN